MNNTALKIEPALNNVSLIANPTKQSWIRKVICRIQIIFNQTMRPPEDLEAWQRLEFRNNFRHEQDHRRHSWRL